MIEQIDAKIERYLEELDQSDAGEQEQAPSTARAAIEALQQDRERLQALAEQMMARGNRQIVAGETEAAIVGQAPSVIGYNVQTAVDAKHKLIVHHEVVQEANDRRQLYPMASATKLALDVERLRVIADRGYHNGEQSEQCEQEQIEPAVPAQQTVNQYSRYFPKESFRYDSASDTYRCSAGAVMKPRQAANRIRRKVYLTTDCASCALRASCTSGRRRQISRTRGEDAAMRAHERARESNAMVQRSAIVEHPFAWLKRTLGGRFLSRGLQNVKAEIALAITAFNIMRVINVIGARTILNVLPA